MSDGYWWLRARIWEEATEKYFAAIAEKTAPCYYDGKTLVYRIEATKGGLKAVEHWWVRMYALFTGYGCSDRDVLTEAPEGCDDITSEKLSKRWRHWCGDEQHPAYMWAPYTGPRDVTHPEEAMTEQETATEKVKKALVELGDVDAITEVMRAGAAEIERLLSEE